MQYIERELAPDTKIPIRIGFIKPNGAPSIISLWYIDINGKIYCATQKTAKILHYLENKPTCGFEIAADQPPYKGSPFPLHQDYEYSNIVFYHHIHEQMDQKPNMDLSSNSAYYVCIHNSVLCS